MRLEEWGKKKLNVNTHLKKGVQENLPVTLNSYTLIQSMLQNLRLCVDCTSPLWLMKCGQRRYTVNIARAKVICDWEIRLREHVGTESTFLFYF